MPEKREKSETPTTVDNKYRKFLPLCRDISQGGKVTEEDLRKFPGADQEEVDENCSLALHLAAISGQVDTVDLLLKHMPDDRLCHKDDKGSTALELVAISGNIDIAKRLVGKNKRLLEIRGQYKSIPVIVAAESDQHCMTRYLYHETPLRVLLDDGSDQGALLLAHLINPKMLDLAVDLFRRCPSLGVTQSKHGPVPVTVLATMPSLFPSATKMGFLKRFVYSRIKLDEMSKVGNLEAGDFQAEDPTKHTGSQDTEPKTKDDCQPRHASKAPEAQTGISQPKHSRTWINELRRLKLIHTYSKELLQGICAQISLLDSGLRVERKVIDAMFLAVQHGVEEFVAEIIRVNPSMLWSTHPQKGVNLLHYAVQCRQERIFKLWQGLDCRRKRFLKFTDNEGNNILHIAGNLSPLSKLESIPGAALQMQRELQWFKEVESVVEDIQKEKLNVKQQRPRERFTLHHRALRAEAEKWMKDAAQSYITAAALIVTIMFTVAFTLPGGISDVTGLALRIKDSKFMLFIISDIISFFAASTSLLIFLGILTTRYSEDDFLVSLPLKVMIGLSMLFVSIVAMVMAFSAGLFTMVQQESWIFLPVVSLATIPVILFVGMQYPLLTEMLVSTFRSGVLEKREVRPRV